MRIASLHLKAYGPFTGAVLDFERPAAGLQVVYGPNERGKSTAMRALVALLFGFPTTTDDGFGRDYSALRVGAVLDDGVRRLALMRRKGTRATLFGFDPDTGAEHPDRVLDQALLDGLLGGLDRQRFLRMHGLGSEQLRAGGRALVDSGSDLGTVLFEAASGVPRMRAVVAALQAEADALFVPRGQKPRLNATLAEVDERHRRAQELGTRPRDWAQRRDALEAARDDVERLESTLRTCRTNIGRLERLLGLVPQVAKLAAVRAQLAELAGVPRLEPEVAQRIAGAGTTIAQADAALAQARAGLDHNLGARDALRVSQPHLDEAVAIVQLVGRIDEFETTRIALPAAIAEARAAGLALRRAFSVIAADADAGPAAPEPGGDADAGPAAPEPDGDADVAARALRWLPSRETVAQARQALAERRTAADRRAEAAAALAEAERALDDARYRRDSAPDVPEPAALEAVVEAATAAGDLEPRLAALRARREAADASIARQAAALGGADGESLARMGALPLADVERAESAARARATARAALEARRAEPATTLPELLARREALVSARAVVGRDALVAARSTRELRLVDAGRADEATRRAAFAALGDAIRDADRIADARFDDASRLADIESLSQRIDQLRAAIAGFDDEAARLADAERDAAHGWAALLSALGLPHREPAAYRDWEAGRARLHDEIGRRDALAAEERSVARQIDRHRELIATACRDAGLPAPPPSLAAALTHARRSIEAAQAARRERDRLRQAVAHGERDRDRRRAVLAEHDAAFAAGEAAWRRLAASLRLDGSPEPARVDARLAEFDVLRDAFAAWEAADRHFRLSEARVSLLRADVVALAARLGVDAPAPGTEASFVDACRIRLHEAERARDDRLRLDTEAVSLRAAIDDARRRRDAAAATLAALQARAGAADLDALLAVVDAGERRRAAEREVATLEALIRETTGGAYEPLVAAAADADPAQLEAELAGLRRTVEADEAARDDALTRRTRAQAEFDAVDGGAQAACAHEEVRERLAAAGRQALDWARLRLARDLLEQAVRRHAERAQGPLLAAAARWFSRLTGGRWRDLRPDWSGDVQILVAEGADGARLPIERLSEGTADALFLSLRLAAIDVRLDGGPPVPLLLDDVLSTFDDERAALALQALADLGQRNQVVYFTHHAHLVELARRVLPPAHVAIGELVHGPVAA